jgi:hypothetical protein
MAQSEQSQQPRWLADLIDLVRQLCPPQQSQAGKGAGQQEPEEMAKPFGTVAPDDERGPGWFSIPLAGHSFESDQLEAAYLAPHEGGQDHKFQLIETVHDGNVLRVRAAEHAPRHGLLLWVPDRDTGRLYASLVEGLSSISDFGLVERIAVGDATPVPPEGPGEKERVPGLNDGQRGALRACLAPGVHLVWGPPGTGKTQVISRALRELMDRGKSVLLVSGTNIAVDNALERAARDIDPRPGVMIRAGDPHLPEIARNPAICLEALIRKRQQGLEHKRLELTERIASLKVHPALARLEADRAALAGFDLDAYQAAEARLRNAEALTARQADYAAALQRAADVQQGEAVAAGHLQRVAQEHAQAQGARPFIEAAEGQARYLATLEQAVATASSLANSRELEHAEATALLAAARNPFGKRRLRAGLKEAEDNLAWAQAALEAASREQVQQTPRITAGMDDNRKAAHPHSRASLDHLDARLAHARAAADEAARATAAQDLRAREAHGAVTRVQAAPQPTDADASLVAEARAAALPDRHAGLAQAEQDAAGVQREIGELEAEHERLLDRMSKEAPQVRREIVAGAQVVATTLAMLRMRPELREREYHHVLIDEVSFAPPPDVIYAASRADVGVTLLGDFLQNGPIMPDRLSKSADGRIKAAAERWYGRDIFAFFSITGPKAALSSLGCAVLTEQYRFGPAINTLANAAAYDGSLTVGQPRPDDADDGPEVVFVDVDGLGADLTHIRPGVPSGRWWPVGALVARALAAQRVRQGSEVGIVVPYRTQAGFVREMIKEEALEAAVSVGTAHAFQGREFDTVIFDLVDNDGTGWIARGNLQQGLSGLRVFNVGITRTKLRLYLIGNATAVRAARTGPLLAIKDLGTTGGLRVVRARQILGLPDMPERDPVAREVWQALHSVVTIVGVYDERQVPDELRRRLDEARKRIWLWSPWVGKSSDELLPHLRAAQDRDVPVHPVVLWPEEVQPDLQNRHQAIGAELARTVYLRNMHQKIIIIDDRLTFIGSMNVLAHPRNGRLETMALLESRALARQYLDHERADELGNPPTCGDCHAPVRRVQRVTERGKAQLHWVCMAPTASGNCPWRKPFPAADGGRYERQPRNKPKRSRP